MTVRYEIAYIRPSNRTRSGLKSETAYAGTNRAEAIRLARELAEQYPDHFANIVIVSRETLADVVTD